MARKRITYDLFGKLQLATIEREVEDAYNNGISLFFTDSPIEHPFNCDGFISEGLMLRLIIEYKFDEVLSNAVARARVLVQVLYYMKRFEDGGLPLPNVIMVGDKNECFVIHANQLVGYLDEDLDWSMAPSSAGEGNPRLVMKISQNEDINPFIFKIESGFDVSVIVSRIRELAVNVKRYVRVTEHNIAEIYDYFVSNVLRNPHQLEPHIIVEIFIGILLEPMKYYQHPGNRNILVGEGGKHYSIYGDAYIAFFDYYNRVYTPQEKMKFTEIADRLIDDTARRFNGEFFTPVLFVDYAHRLLARYFGEDWRERYVVWDNCCGTKNLTRDYRFNELYCSTLNVQDLNIAQRYNTDACSFQSDFLNDSFDNLPEGLKAALRANRPLCLILNPPYATSASGNGKNGKSGVSETFTYQDMISHKMGRCSQNLYAQFMYRIVMLKRVFSLTNLTIGLFSPTLFFSSGEWTKFREMFCREFCFLDGVQFKASHFADVAPSWGISFSVWRCGVTQDMENFNYTLIDKVNGEIVPIGRKVVYNASRNRLCSEWIRMENRADSRRRVLYPHLSSAIKVSNKCNQTLIEGSMGSICALSNNVDKNTSGVALFSSIQTQGTACISNSVTERNFEKCCAFFAARKLIDKTWINSKDEYLVPNESSDSYRSFVYDAVVFSLFHSSSNQSSLRNIEYNGRRWNIPNEWFWMKRSKMESLANQYGNEVCFLDARVGSERFVYNYLTNVRLSAEALAVLDKAKSLVVSSFEYRLLLDAEHPEYQINNWDAGWYQIRALLKVYDRKGLEEFGRLYKILSDKMRPKVYELGFLK